jgi:hypothetical protein
VFQSVVFLQYALGFTCATSLFFAILFLGSRRRTEPARGDNSPPHDCFSSVERHLVRAVVFLLFLFGLYRGVRPETTQLFLQDHPGISGQVSPHHSGKKRKTEKRPANPQPHRESRE